MKIAVITCYKHPDYVRAQTLRSGLAGLPATQVIVIKNRHRGLLRYPEVCLRLIGVRLKYRPDVYLLTFRGYEFLPLADVLSWPKPLIFDELVQPVEWLSEPREQRWARLVPKRLVGWLYRIFLRRCQVVLADTDAHARNGARLNKISTQRYETVPVSADENIFRPASEPKKNKNFRVFYYGNMLPLHGLPHVLQAAVMLRELPIDFVLAGGNAAVKRAVEAARLTGARLTYTPWLQFEALPAEIRASDLVLGGPFGNTTQARLVITGKTQQALACAVPTVVGETTAAPMFIDKANCLLVAQADAAALAEAITWAYQHPAELANIGEAGRELYEREFSAVVVQSDLAAMLKEL